MNTPSPSRWSELFDIAVSIINQANRDYDLVSDWSFGGGTALMLQIDHRESHDVDLFIRDPQALAYLNPETQGYVLALAPGSYVSDGSASLKIVFDGVGEIDFICCEPTLDGESALWDVRGACVKLETPAEIIAKKVFHRGARLQPRDMFDIAAVARVRGAEYLARPLSGMPDKVELALNVATAYRSQLLRPVLSGLNVKPGFEGLQETAREETVDVLRMAMNLAWP
ncbi:nucleotidyl transferase AbiEii/AbiGii toxin family protein [Maritimibacter harenae]|uniref:nucleotidyl transferase AbiEii/AbiGii toxin family protein n=1 Tax=Maritimibacter harenae TaxID=2606218 RepID=UPI001F25BE6C|nr:nucleotidyl transferase AbiEii/AbiGii toxin family protein [Maritimibacter harenae]